MMGTYFQGELIDWLSLRRKINYLQNYLPINNKIMSEEKKEATGVNNPDWNPKDNTGTKKTRKPRNFDNILSGAKSLPLKERVDMINALRETVTAELETIKAAAADAEKTVNGLG